MRRAVELLPGWANRMGAERLSCRLADASRDTPELVARLDRAGAKVVSVKQAGDLERAYLELMARGNGPGLEEAA